jgi:hypothetical protein
MISSRKIIMLAAVVAALATGLSWNGTGRVIESVFFSEAQARVGRPLTPMSYAGVARRTKRAPTMRRPAHRSWTPMVGSRPVAEPVARTR